MKTRKIFKSVNLLMLFTFSFEIILFSSNTNAQSINSIEDRIGGSGSNTVSEDSKNDNTFLYIAAGAIVIGLIVWKVFLDKKEPKPQNDGKSDSTKTSLDKSFYKNLSDQELQLRKIQEQIPFKIYLGLQKNEQNIPGKNLSLGFKFKL